MRSTAAAAEQRGPQSEAGAETSAACERVRAFASSERLSRWQLAAAPVRFPRPSRLAKPLSPDTPRIGAGLSALGLHTVGDLLEHLPHRTRPGRTVATLMVSEPATVAVQVQRIERRPVRRRGMKPLVQATVADETGSIVAAFFNQPWLVDRYLPGTRLLLHGALRPRGTFAVSHHAVSEESFHEGKATAVAHYPAAEGVSSTQILTLVHGVQDAIREVTEPLPAALRAAQRLPDRQAALAAMHFPTALPEREAARRRLAFEELLLGQLALRRRREAHARNEAPALESPRGLSARWLQRSLPFTPTADQLQAMREIDADIAQAKPMQRLLMGEVGSGKTVVALYAMLRAVEHGMQAALMAPTETLAEQHFATLQSLAPEDLVASALLTGSTPAARRKDALGKLASGELQIVVGTHALIEGDVHFSRLAVVIVDEQHRFGVRQRAALAHATSDRSVASSGALATGPDLVPHVLHMTATPIPRTLALTAYGDLDVTMLKRLPRGRRPIATHIASTAPERARAYERMREELRSGRQAFVVCALVEESEQLQARAATAEHERLRKGELRDFRVALLHGQMRPKQKQSAMAAFAAGEADVMVCTTVIEVGIDVPNATVMLVEDAERYGISQLHQLRGRVGRGEHDSLCLLFGPKSSKRLQALAAHRDGFRLAEIDLRLRGEGDLEGTGQSIRQSGQRELRVAQLPDDEELLVAAGEHAKRILARDPRLAAPEHALLRDALRSIPA